MAGSSCVGLNAICMVADSKNIQTMSFVFVALYFCQS